MLGSAEAANAEIGTPEGKLIIESVTCKSRRVGIPADQKVPTTGYFKSTETEVCSGRKRRLWNMILRRERARKLLEEKRKAAESGKHGD